MTKRILLITILTIGLTKTQAQSITVPIGGNAWVQPAGQTAKIDSNGLTYWDKGELSIYVRVENTGTLNASLNLKTDGASTLALKLNKQQIIKKISSPKFTDVQFGTFNISHPGYLKFTVAGLKKTGATYADIASLNLSGSALDKGAAYVKDNHGDYFYWGRRGPSVHLNYSNVNRMPDKVAWFYNQITVPRNNDVIGSYFMADGFNGGYFGMQVNSPTERHILFSIWSPFQTDDPKSIPDSLRVKLIKKGEGVHINEFGSEGSGGQSYLVFPWQADKTYQFLVHAEPDSIAKTTIFTAYFKESSEKNWRLIASFKRPKSGFYLKGLYSFLENFEPEMGTVTRMAYFGDQWVADPQGHWTQLTAATFTADATANINYRKDYAGGQYSDRFFLQNCGFFNDFTPVKTKLLLEAIFVKPLQINLNKLP